MNIYDQIEFWENRVYPCCSDKDVLKYVTSVHIKYVKEQLLETEKILDFGPGFGRLFPAYKNVKEVVGYDIVSTYKDQIISEAKKYNFKFEFCVGQDIDKINFPDKYFDAAVGVEVLLHQTPDKITQIMSELCRVATKVIIISFMNVKERFGGDGDLTYQYCFNYDYIKICRENGWTVTNDKIINKQLYFVFERY